MNLLNINSYKKDGFVKLADIQVDEQGIWTFHNQHSYLFEDHHSWVYAIVSNNEVVKIGETGKPLGIRPKRGDDSQPVIGTHNRFGRLRGFGKTFADEWQRDTDVRIRKELFEESDALSVWVRKCESKPQPITVYGDTQYLHHAYHKDLEKAYLSRILSKEGRLPRLNIGKI